MYITNQHPTSNTLEVNAVGNLLLLTPRVTHGVEVRAELRSSSANPAHPGAQQTTVSLLWRGHDGCTYVPWMPTAPQR